MSDSRKEEPHRIAVALSGGGSRAIAFHLGCLRALHQEGILDRVHVISAVSGGAVLGALYRFCPGDFQAFEARVRTLLAGGLVKPALVAAVTTAEGVKALVCWTALVAVSVVRLVGVLSLKLLPGSWQPVSRLRAWLARATIRRAASRTTILRRALSATTFNGAKLTDLRTDRPRLIINACDLSHKSAFYFSSHGVGSWRLGETDPGALEIAHAVTASAAYPVLLPALDEYLVFKKKGVTAERRVVLTDGGVYDNLALAPLWPDRDPDVSLHASEACDTIVACRAGYGLEEASVPTFMFSRLISAMNSIHARAQNFAMKRLFDLRSGGKLSAFIVPYLGQDDDRLAYPAADLVDRRSAAAYPTNFSRMPAEWIDLLSKRGEQLTRALLQEHMAHLLRPRRDG